MGMGEHGGRFVAPRDAVPRPPNRVGRIPCPGAWDEGCLVTIPDDGRGRCHWCARTRQGEDEAYVPTRRGWALIGSGGGADGSTDEPCDCE